MNSVNSLSAGLRLPAGGSPASPRGLGAWAAIGAARPSFRELPGSLTGILSGGMCLRVWGTIQYIRYHLATWTLSQPYPYVPYLVPSSKEPVSPPFYRGELGLGGVRGLVQPPPPPPLIMMEPGPVCPSTSCLSAARSGRGVLACRECTRPPSLAPGPSLRVPDRGMVRGTPTGEASRDTAGAKALVFLHVVVVGGD